MRSTTELRQHGFRIDRAYEESVWTGQGWQAYCWRMAKSDPEKLAAALRENLRKRKDQARRSEKSKSDEQQPSDLAD